MLPWVVKYRPPLRLAICHLRPLAKSHFLSPFFSAPSALFQVPYPASPLFATHTKTAGVCPDSSQFGTRTSPLQLQFVFLSPFFWNVQPSNLRTRKRVLTYPLSFHILVNSFALTKMITLFFSSDSALFAKNHPGWGYPPLSKKDKIKPRTAHPAVRGGGGFDPQEVVVVCEAR
jgi:hypothetical protein